jgi:response regulator RpfG family c-di-GMP phosphodiesterase
VNDVQQTEHEPVSVLLVDDEENILRSIQRLLMDEENVEITIATSGEEGLKLLPALTNLGLIVSDQRMPGMTGALFLEKARDIKPDASRIILTGYADVTAAVDAINKGGAWRYLSKPWNDEDLLRIIREGLERYRMIVENIRLSSLVLKQNQELEEWNSSLKQRVLGQTTEIRKKNEELHEVNRQVKNDFNGVITAFSELLNLRDQRCRSHGKNVSNLACNAALVMKLSAAEVETIRIAGLLHDIGELGIPDDILVAAPEVMNEEKAQIYQTHPVRGQTALDAVEQLRPAGILIRHHHERWDGGGFPDRLAGDRIPIGARILACADLIDRMMSYDHTEHALAASIARIELESGHYLDPELIEIFRSTAAETYPLHNNRQNLVEREIQPGALHVGMRLARDIISGTGLLLLGHGEELDVTRIASISRYYRIDPPGHGVFVLVER